MMNRTIVHRASKLSVVVPDDVTPHQLGIMQVVLHSAAPETLSVCSREWVREVLRREGEVDSLERRLANEKAETARLRAQVARLEKERNNDRS